MPFGGSNCSNRSFQPTYEELKRSCYIQNSVFCLCFQPTYEELKRLNMAEQFQGTGLFSAYLRGIETFLFVRLSLLHLLHVFSLPTRNWNKRNSIIMAAAQWFSAYLRGIETCKVPADHHTASVCFQPTYEELKLQPRGNVIEWWITFSAYLRGIETIISGSPK